MKHLLTAVLLCGLLAAGQASASGNVLAEGQYLTDQVQPAVETEAAARPAPSGAAMGLLFFVFVLAIFLGVELISKVPSQLHTPLMSGSNAISGISVVGALIAAGMGHSGVMTALGTLAVALAMINVVGGYLVTDRMLGMFKHKDKGTP